MTSFWQGLKWTVEVVAGLIGIIVLVILCWILGGLKLVFDLCRTHSRR